MAHNIDSFTLHETTTAREVPMHIGLQISIAASSLIKITPN